MKEKLKLYLRKQAFYNFGLGEAIDMDSPVAQGAALGSLGGAGYGATMADILWAKRNPNTVMPWKQFGLNTLYPALAGGALGAVAGGYLGG